MEIKDLLKVVGYAINFYRDNEYNNKFGLMEYYSLTDIEPRELAKYAREDNNKYLSSSIIHFDVNNYWLKVEVNMKQKFKFHHSINGYELTDEDKLTIFEKLKSENLPLMEGIFDYAAIQYVTKGVDSISKEQIKNKVIEAYNASHNIRTSIIKTGEQLKK